MNSFAGLVKNRRSIRQFADEKLKVADVSIAVAYIQGIGHKERVVKPHEEEHLRWENVYIERFT